MNNLVAFLAAILLCACQTTVTTDEVVRFFNDTAFRGTPGGDPMSGKVLAEVNYTQHRLYRWNNQIQIRIGVMGNDAYREQIAAIVKRVTEISGLPAVVLAPGEDGGNFLIDFVADAGFIINKTEHVPCYAHTEGKNGTISKVEIMISVEEPDLVQYCIAHELIHGFGLLHSNILPSTMNPETFEARPTRWDEIALRTLYDPRLEADMTRIKGLPIARMIIKDLLTQSR